MAITYEDSTGSAETGFVSTHNVTLPATKTADDIWLMIWVRSGSGGTVTGPSGWTEVAAVDMNSNQGFRVYIKRATGSETGTADLTTALNNRSSAIIRRYSGVSTGTLSGVWDVSADANGSGTTPDPGSVTPSWGSDAGNLAVACAGSAGTGDLFTGYPSSYLNTSTQDDSNSCAVAGADKTFSGSSENPGSFTLAGSENWGAVTVALKPEPAAGDGTADMVMSGSGGGGADVPYLVGASTASESSLTENHTINYPTVAGGIEADDFIILTTGVDQSTNPGNVYPPSGFATLIGAAHGATGQKLYSWFKRADGTETSSDTETWTTSASDSALSQTHMRIYRGVNNGADADSWKVSANLGGTSTAPDPRPVPNVPWYPSDGTRCVAVGVAYYNGVDVDAGPSGYYHLVGDPGSNTVTLMTSDSAFVGASPNPGPYTISASDDWRVHSIALAPGVAIPAGDGTADMVMGASGAGSAPAGDGTADMVMAASGSGSAPALAVDATIASGLTASIIPRGELSVEVTAAIDALVAVTGWPTLEVGVGASMILDVIFAPPSVEVDIVMSSTMNVLIQTDDPGGGINVLTGMGTSGIGTGSSVPKWLRAPDSFGAWGSRFDGFMDHLSNVTLNMQTDALVKGFRRTEINPDDLDFSDPLYCYKGWDLSPTYVVRRETLATGVVGQYIGTTDYGTDWTGRAGLTYTTLD